MKMSVSKRLLSISVDIGIAVAVSVAGAAASSSSSSPSWRRLHKADIDRFARIGPLNSPRL
jgi:uncharacterized membrane protein YfcA